MIRFAFLTLLLTCSLQAAATGPRALLLDGEVVGADVFAVGEHGGIFRSPDSGRSWARVPTPVTATLTGVAFAPGGQVGWIVGHDAVILGTVDGGRSWQVQWQGPQLETSFLDVCALDARRAIAIGAYGFCLVTNDGGKTWTTKKVLDEDMHLNRLTRSPAGTLYLAGERGTLLRSRDDGATWQRIDSPYDGSFYGVLILGDTQLLAHGLRGRVFRSTNDGDLWQAVPLDRPMLIATALTTKSGAVILAGQARALYLSRDGGATFSVWSQPNFDTAVAELLEAPDGAILALGEAGATRLSAP